MGFFNYNTMKEKIANALKTEYANLGLNTEVFNGVASMLEKTITDESTIKASITEPYVADLLKSIQSTQDRLRGEKSTVLKDFEAYKKLHPEVGKEETHTDDPAIETLKAEMAEMKTQLLEARESERKAKLLEAVRKQMRDGGSTNDYILKQVTRDVAIGADDTAETLAERLKPLYDAQYKEAFGHGAVPPKGDPHSEGYKPGAYDSKNEMLRREGLLPPKENK